MPAMSLGYAMLTVGTIVFGFVAFIVLMRYGK